MRTRSTAWVAAACAMGLAACEGRPRVATSRVEDRDTATTGPAIAVLDLSDGIPEEAPAGLLGLSPAGASMNGLVRAVERLATDRDVRGILVRLGSASVGLARAGEAGALLASLGAKVPVFCHADDYSNATLYLAALGCKRVWVSPAASVDAIGIAAQTVYFHKLLADELGVDVDFLQVGKFKGAEEPFTRDGPSPEARESLEATLGDMRASWLEGIRRGRPNTGEDTAEDGPYSAAAARDHGLVDEVGYFEEARAALEEATGAVRARVVLGPTSTSPGGGLSDVLRTLAGESLG
ncbi:MAG TPA: S49 family peptidase, partial [Polyangiaceae bacterium]|nr:S49 family peptidase [Polyangiaceae bacterium]